MLVHLHIFFAIQMAETIIERMSHAATMDLTTCSNKIRVIAADDSEFMREAYANLLYHQAEIEIVGTARDGEEAVILAEVLRPDVAILDIQMPNMNGLEASTRMAELNPQMGLVIVSTFDNPQYILKFFSNDPRGKAYLLKASLSSVDDFIRTIKAVTRRWTVLDPQIARRLLENRLSSASSLMEPLTKIQVEMFIRVVTGYEEQDIYEMVPVTSGIPEERLNQAYEKLDIPLNNQHPRRVEAVLKMLS